MANKNLFASLRDALIPKADARNSHGAPAYALAPKQALAQYAATGCFGRTFYATAEEQLEKVQKGFMNFFKQAEKGIKVCLLRQPGARVVTAPGRLDLDDFGAEFAQRLAAQGARQNFGDIDDAQALQWVHLGQSLLGSLGIFLPASGS